MIGIVLVAHGDLARAFLAVLEDLHGLQPGVRAMSIGLSGQFSRSELLEAVAEVDGGQGVVLLTDLFGGTPCNLAISLMRQAEVEVVSGFNLPLLIKLTEVRDQPLAQAVQIARQTGRQAIEVMSAQLAPGTKPLPGSQS